MVWLIEFDKKAVKELEKLDKKMALRITKFLRQRVAGQQNPRRLGEALTGSRLGNYWKYRVGNYRIIADIQDARICVLVVHIGHRREVYRA